MLRNCKTFRKETEAERKYNPIQEEKFIEMCNFGSDNHDAKKNLGNEKLQKTQLRKYLERKYDKRLAQKIIVLFEWPHSFLKVNDYFDTIEQIILNPSPDDNECIKTLKLLTFNLYDMNNDQQLCEADLFSLMRCQQDER